MKVRFIICVCLLFSSLSWGQRIEGKITDAEDGLGIIGATVMEEGTTNGTITDIDGQYTITLTTENPKLMVSFLGYKDQIISVDGRSSIDVMMNIDAATLDEVVVVGYGVQKKSVVTGAIAKVKSEDLEDMQLARIEQSLQGRTAGVRVTQGSGQPGSGSTVRVRGTTTIGDSNPLYVVDGVVVNGGIDYLNQSDIESIEVLKDAASASIYGARSANGVILVTTKKGKDGQMSVNYNAYKGWQRPWKKLSLLNATEYGILMNEASVASGGPILFDEPRALGEGTDWQSHVFRDDAPITNHELSLTAGNDKSTYYASFGYFDQEGIVSENQSRFTRWTARLNSEHKVTDRIKFGTNLSYAKIRGQGISTNSEFGSPLSRAINLDPITPLYETDPERLASPVFANNAVVSDENGVFGISDLVTSEILNPVAALSTGEGYGWSDKVVANAYGEIELFDGFSYRSSIGTDLAFWGGEGFTPVFYLNAANRNDVNDYNRSQNRGLYWIFENVLKYSTNLNGHDFQFIFGTAAEKNQGEGIGGTIQDIPVNNLEDASLGFATSVESQSFYGFEYQSTISSVFTRLNYNYNEKYLLTATMRRDGSSKFGSNYLYGYFPSVSLGWNITDEDFFPQNNIFNYIKLRGSWGINGNDRIGDFRFLPIVVTGGNYTFGQFDELVIGASPGDIANPDLRWEETKQLNFGFDSRLFEHVTLGIDVYRKRTSGILQRFDIPAFVGFGSPDANVGEMNNDGVEIELGINKDIGPVNVDWSGVIAHLRNEVVFLAPGVDFLPGQTFSPQGLELSRTSVGEPIGYLFGYKTDGLFQNQSEVDAYVNAEGEPLQPDAAPGDIRFVDFNEDGIIDENDRTKIGDPTPTWSYGTTLNVTVGDFDFLVFGQGVYGNDIYQTTRRFDLQMANLTGDALGRWTGEGTSTDFPRLIFNDPNRNFSRSSDFYVESGAFFRIKNFQVGYSLPNNLLDRLKLTKARFYIGANNLITFTAYSGFDPEIGDGGGIDRGLYPQPRTFLVGTNITF